MTQALGVIECRSYPALLQAADAMVRAGRVELVAYERTEGGYMSALVRGEAAAVRAATEAGARAAARAGAAASVHVLAEPLADLAPVVPIGRARAAVGPQPAVPQPGLV